MQQFPKVVGRVRVGVAVQGGADAGIGAHEDAYQVWFEDVDQRGEMGVF